MLCYSMLFQVIHMLILQQLTYTYVEHARDIGENYINSEQGRSLRVLFYNTWYD